MKLTLAITGASGTSLAKKFIEYLPKEIELHLITTDHAKIVESLEERNITLHNNKNIGASIASGSFGVDAMAVIPCSMNTLAKISYGIADNLVTRSASVMLKEQKKLLLAPREMPFSAIPLENMLKLSRLNVIISPPVMGYYSECATVDEMERFVIGKWYDSLGIENDLYTRWK
jgi:4-hydroxy-3-polyprenylbenzoate decarboxylase